MSVKFNYHDELILIAEFITEKFYDFLEGYDKFLHPKNKLLLIDEDTPVKKKEKLSNNMYMNYIMNSYEITYSSITRSLNDGLTAPFITKILDALSLNLNDFIEYLAEKHSFNLEEDSLSHYLYFGREKRTEHHQRRKQETMRSKAFLKDKIICRGCGEYMSVRGLSEMVRYCCRTHDNEGGTCKGKMKSVAQNKVLKQIKNEIDVEILDKTSAAKYIHHVYLETDGSITVKYKD